MEATTTSTTPSVNDTGIHHQHQRGALDRELFCPRLERLLLGAAAELGQRGNLAQTIASIERGGSGGGAIDNDGAMVERINRNPGAVRQLRELEQQWRALSAKHQATALAHYIGTTRAHPTLRERFGAGQGGLAGVVLYRWQLRQAKVRGRVGTANAAKAAERLEALRAELGPIEREIATLKALVDAPLPDLGPAPEMPEPAPLVLSEEGRREYWRPYRRARLAWSAPLRAARRARRAATERRAALLPLLPALQAEQARLCAQLADAASAGDTADDEEQLVRVCRSGSLDAAGHLSGAEADVRALHRAWQLVCRQVGRRQAREWIEEGATA